MFHSVHFMRAVAAIVVTTSHTFNVVGVPKSILIGDVGVDIFFVISGFVVTVSTPDGSPPVRFLLRRLIRVVPLYWLATFSIVGYSYWKWGVAPDPREMADSLLLYPSLGGRWFPLLFPGWTLAFELLFYFTFFVALIFVRRRAALFAAAMMAALMALNPSTIQTASLLEFSAGVLLGYAYFNRAQSYYDDRLGVFLLSAGLVIFTVNIYGVATRSIGWGIPSLFLVAGLLQFEPQTLLRASLVRILGDASYSLYLFHIPVMTVLREAAFTLGFDYKSHLPLFCIFLVIASIVLSIAIHLAIEKPMLRIFNGMLDRSQRKPSLLPVN